MNKLTNVKLILAIASVLAISTSCSVKHNVEVKGKLEPIEIHHTVGLDTKSLYEFFKEQCANDFTNEADIKKCADDKINSFVEKFT